MSGRWLIVVAVIFAVVSSACGPKTKLVIEMTGGFAYIPTPSKTLEVAYLNDVKLEEVIAGTNQVVCDVQQIGTELRVLRGDIIEADPSPAPASKEFNLDKAVITFPALAKGAAVKFDRKGWKPDPPTPSTPGNHDVEQDWHNLQFVPGIRERHLPNHPLDPNWPNEVNGRMVLQGGTITGTLPSDPLMKPVVFDFKVDNTKQFSSAMTDKLIYTVNVPGDYVELIFSTSAYGYKRLRIVPPASGKKEVRLALKGLHSMGTAASMMHDHELRDHCAFYSLLQPTPPSSTWLRPHYVAPMGQQNTTGGGQPSPGFFCNPDWF